MEIVMVFLEIIYGISILAMSLYGANSLYLTYVYWQTGPKPIVDCPPDSELPIVTVQLPIYNERYTVVRLLETVLDIDYPTHLMDIQILDDSTDDTSDIIQETLTRLDPPQGMVQHMRRTNRVDYKAGALSAGLAAASGDFVTIFDADFLPPRDFLRKTIPQFSSSEIGCVQCRWGHVNRDYNYFTRIQAMGIDGHFIIEQAARNFSGFFMNFNGTAGVWRKECIVDGGGWTGDTLAEDLDLSYRVQLRGWKFNYQPMIVCPAELPVHINAFKLQQSRWAKGSIQTAKKLLPVVWRSQFPLYVKIQGTLHLTGYMVHVLMMAVVFLTLPIGFSTNAYLMLVSSVLMFCAIGPPMMYASSQISLDAPQRIVNLPLLMLLGYGLAVNNAAAVIEGLMYSGGEFKRTPKFGVRKRSDLTMKLGRYGQLVKNFPQGEFAMLCMLAVFFVLAYVYRANRGIYPWLITYFASYLYMFLMGITDGLESVWRDRGVNKAQKEEKMFLV
eukprot:GFYU01002578.1.p1 GENE.GFYU01002578.1~~GFYU01002578.1.p1  ORF type:complete len:500 (+),score=158.13 GFYU01002578.1:325-1824(+)